MLTLTFRTPRSSQERACEAVRAVTITARAIYCDERPEPAATYRASLWRIQGDYFTSAEIPSGAYVLFRSNGANAGLLGPFWNLKLISGYLFNGNVMLARTLNGKWFTYADERECDSIVLRPAAGGLTMDMPTYHDEVAKADMESYR
jgi:hypothetical protein